MVLLQHKLNVKLSQRQILTPGLVQMVSVLALNKLELRDMITAEMVENPVLEELEDSVPLLDEVGRREEDRERAKEAAALGLAAVLPEEEGDAELATSDWNAEANPIAEVSASAAAAAVAPATEPASEPQAVTKSHASVHSATPAPPANAPPARPTYKPGFNRSDLAEAIEVVRQMDPPGVACRDLRDCLLYQLRYQQQQIPHLKNDHGEATAQVINDAVAIVDQHLRALQMKQHKEIGKAIGRPIEVVQQALDYIRTLDPRPGLRYNKVQPRLIEPDVAFIKHGDEWLCLMTDDDVPQLRLNPAHQRLLTTY